MKHHIAPIISKKLLESRYQILTLNNKFKNYCSSITYETSYNTYNFKKVIRKQISDICFQNQNWIVLLKNEINQN